MRVEAHPLQCIDVQCTPQHPPGPRLQMPGLALSSKSRLPQGLGDAEGRQLIAQPCALPTSLRALTATHVRRFHAPSTRVRGWLLQVSDDIEGRQLMAELGVGTLPTIQYYRQGKLLWEQIGSVGMEQELGEGEVSGGCLWRGVRIKGPPAFRHVQGELLSPPHPRSCAA